MTEMPFENKLDELDLQLQMFCKAPTRQAWDIIQELYRSAEVQLHPDWKRHEQKVHMFMSAVLSNHSDWATTQEHAELLKQAQTRRTWLLSPSGDSQRKLDLIWYSYFATGDTAFPLRVAAIADTLAYGTLREVAIRTYAAVVQTHEELAELCPQIMKIAAYLQTQ
jgi:hypothetical protein